MKVGRYLLMVLIGAIIGGIIGWIIGFARENSIISILNTSHNYQIALISCIVTSIIIIILTLVLLKIHKDALRYKSTVDDSIEDDKADHFERQANKKVLSGNIILSLATLISFLNMLVIVFVNHSDRTLFLYIIPFLVTIIPSIMHGFFNRKFDQRVPKMGEKQYTEKLFHIMDEGERHITLSALYKIFTVNQILIMVAILFLGLFSLITGINQFLSILFFIIIYVYNIFGYYFKIRKFHR